MASPHQDENLCSTMAAHHALVATSPAYQESRRQIEAETRAFTEKFAGEGLRTGIARIPVVVHVVYNTLGQNISDEQVQSQIEVLNLDFRRQNADRDKVPAPFAAVAADARIEFSLARRDPDGAATSGITRKKTERKSWGQNVMQQVKSSRTDGADPWPADRYLNIWVANLGDGLLGFAAFPGGPARLDGVVIGTNYFGTVGTAQPPFNLGRTATHEVGHWLNLLHIWGDDYRTGATAHQRCAGSDECADTPNQERDRVSKPTFPAISCNNGPHGDMFMNYMDYVDDDAMFMFTEGQVTRMQAALAGPRASLLESDAAVPVDSTAARWEGALSSDPVPLTAGDRGGAEPLSAGERRPTWVSDDIWVRQEPEAEGQLPNRCHQNPVAGKANQIHVRVHGPADTSGSTTTTLEVYWAKASPSLAWPAPWDGSISSPAVMGGLVGSKPIAAAPCVDHLSATTCQVFCFDWTPPDPAQYASFGAEKANFSLLARVETAGGPALRESASLDALVQANTNIVWRNVSLVDTEDNGSRYADVVVGEFGAAGNTTTAAAGKVKLAFNTPADETPSLFDWGMVLVDLEGGPATMWTEAGTEIGNGLVWLGPGRLALTRSGATLEAPALGEDVFGTLRMHFVPTGKGPSASQVLGLDVTQLGADGELVGGQRVLLRTAAGRKAPEWDSQLGTFDGVSWKAKDKSGGGCGCGC